MTSMKRNNSRRFSWVFWVVVIFWVLVIFFLSSQTGIDSKQLSKGVTAKIVALIMWVMPQSQISAQFLHDILRPLAHFFAFMILSLLVMYALRRNGIRGKRGALLALGICAVIAMMDETVQFFIPGRDARVLDMMLDSLGAAVGIAIYSLMSRIFN